MTEGTPHSVQSLPFPHRNAGSARLRPTKVEQIITRAMRAMLKFRGKRTLHGYGTMGEVLQYNIVQVPALCKNFSNIVEVLVGLCQNLSTVCAT